MGFDLRPFNPATTAWVFPGQGAQTPTMLEAYRHDVGFGELYEQTCTRLGHDPLASAASDLTGNAASSLLTVLASVLSIRRLRDEHPGFVPAAVAGYSVGQWTALYAAGVITLEQLIHLVFRRAELMDACVSRCPPSGMLAVMGVPETDVRQVCTVVSSHGEPLTITNENAPGQFTLGGTLTALIQAEDLLAPLRPKRLVRLPVAGAWHSPMLQPAVASLRSMLLDEPLLPGLCPIIDNTTGDWLPTDRSERCDALSRQVAAPVLWSKGVKTMEARGVRDVLEVGYGDMLTKFGFFISRSLRHHAVFPAARP